MPTPNAPHYPRIKQMLPAFVLLLFSGAAGLTAQTADLSGTYRIRVKADNRYLHEDGSPLPLARFASEGGELSFESLVAGVNSDIRSRVVLDEWLRLGVVRLDDDNRVCLNAEAFVPSEGFDEKAFYFGHNLHDHAAAAASNLLGVQPALLERSVQYDALSEASIALIAKQSREAGMKALLAVNKNALALEQADATREAPKHRMTFGIYFYTEPMPETPASPAGDRGATT